MGAVVLILALYLVVVALAAGATYAYVVRETAIPLATLSATAFWAIAALQGNNVVLYHQDGTSTTVGSPSFQYMATGLAILSFGAWLLWYWGEYPPSEAAADEPHPDGAHNT